MVLVGVAVKYYPDCGFSERTDERLRVLPYHRRSTAVQEVRLCKTTSFTPGLLNFSLNLLRAAVKNISVKIRCLVT